MQLQGEDDPRELLRVLWLAIRDTHGVHTFCRFLLHVMLQSYVDQHPVHKLYSASGKRNSGAAKDLACVLKATRMLRAHYSHLSEAVVLNRRMASLSMMFLATVVEYDNVRLSGKLAAHTQLDPELILDMAVGALLRG